MPGSDAKTGAVAVREFCAFAARSGDIDLRFTPAPSSLEGISGHQAVTALRPQDYQRERSVQGTLQGLALRGRADGVFASPLVVEEIKTHRVPISKIADNQRQLHWAQLKVYGALLAAEQNLERIGLQLCYYQVDTQQQSLQREDWATDALNTAIAPWIAAWQQWQQSEQAHRQARDAALKGLRFPHPDFHGGQRQFSEAVYKSMARGKSLLAEAPTGIGKSIGSIFPALLAMPRFGYDKLIYLTAKTSGRAQALRAIASLQQEADAPPLPLRVLELIAKEKSCVHPDKACHGESCPLAQGFYDRLPAARSAVASAPELFTQAGLQATAAAHQICPYYFAQELIRWADLIVADLNYWFDTSAVLYALSEINGWKLALLVDEAHNLVERARAMYSASLSSTAIAPVQKLKTKGLQRHLRSLKSAFKQVAGEQAAPYQTLAQLPKTWLAAVEHCAAAVGSIVADTLQVPEPLLQSFYFSLVQFLDLADGLGAESLVEVHSSAAGAPASCTVAIRNVLPAPHLAPRFAAAASYVLFSATLQPPAYYRALLGLGSATSELAVGSPFRPEQLQVRIAKRISSRYQHRAASAPAIAARIAAQFAERPGNYLAFLSSQPHLPQIPHPLPAQP